MPKCSVRRSSDVSVEWHKDVAFAVPITHLDFSAMDSLEARVREALGNGSLPALMEELVEERLASERGEVVDKLVAEVLDAEQPKLRVVCMGIAVGLYRCTLKTEQEWADYFGVSKQDIQGLVEDTRERLLLSRKGRTMREAAARERMREGNFRPTKKVPFKFAHES